MTANSSPPSRAVVSPFAHGRFDPRGDRLQQLVAERMAQGVVDGLEPVEVEVEDGEFGHATLGLRKALLEALLEPERG